jgi:hypothetical protein
MNLLKCSAFLARGLREKSACPACGDLPQSPKPGEFPGLTFLCPVLRSESTLTASVSQRLACVWTTEKPIETNIPLHAALKPTRPGNGEQEKPSLKDFWKEFSQTDRPSHNPLQKQSYKVNKYSINAFTTSPWQANGLHQHPNLICFPLLTNSTNLFISLATSPPC